MSTEVAVLTKPKPIPVKTTGHGNFREYGLMIALIVIATVFGCFTLIAFSVLVVVWLWDWNPLAVIAGVAGRRRGPRITKTPGGTNPPFVPFDAAKN